MREFTCLRDSLIRYHFADMALEFIMLPNGKRKLIFENYIFVKQKELADGAISWECSKRRNAQSCRAKVKTDDGIFFGCTNDHTCSAFPNLADVAVKGSYCDDNAGSD